MSATGRGSKRRERDFYSTPEWVTQALLDREDLLWHVSEPACGEGALLRLLHARGWAKGWDIDAASVELCRAQGLNASHSDYLGPHTDPDRVSDVVMNPPYSQAAEFVRRALEVAAPRTKVCALLRLNFLGSSGKRMDLVGPGSCLRSVYVLARRPSFTEDGRTDACEYCWAVWQEGHKGPATVEVIPR